MGYFPQPNSPAFDLQTDIRAKATNTPIFGAGKTDKNRYAKKKKGGARPQTEQFEEDIDGLQQAHEKKSKITKVPAADKFLIGTILTYVDHETVYLAETMRAIAGHLNFQVRNLRPRPEPFQTIPGSVICEWDGGNKTIPFANVVHDDMPVAHDNYQGYYVLTQKVYDFVLGYMSRNEELET